ncbi:MAG: hypothetical protein ACREFF_09610 [Candidatus Udaeobacter sp.]
MLPKNFEADEGNVFCYKLTSVTQAGEELEQRGCGPNFQGGRITLCTCMRYHRTWPSIGKGTWIAGFTRNQTGNELFYLMKVEHVANTFTELRDSDWLPNHRAKSARYDVFGDVYEPLLAATARRPHDPKVYYPPIAGHKHGYNSEWHKDIKEFALGKPHKLLVGEPGKSFIWRHPRYRYKPPPHPRFQLFETVGEFYKHLQ